MTKLHDLTDEQSDAITGGSNEIGPPLPPSLKVLLPRPFPLPGPIAPIWPVTIAQLE